MAGRPRPTAEEVWDIINYMVSHSSFAEAKLRYTRQSFTHHMDAHNVLRTVMVEVLEREDLSRPVRHRLRSYLDRWPLHSPLKPKKYTDVRASLTPETLARIELIMERDRVERAEFIREAVEEKLAREGV